MSCCWKALPSPINSRREELPAEVNTYVNPKTPLLQPKKQLRIHPIFNNPSCRNGVELEPLNSPILNHSSTTTRSFPLLFSRNNLNSYGFSEQAIDRYCQLQFPKTVQGTHREKMAFWVSYQVAWLRTHYITRRHD